MPALLGRAVGSVLLVLWLTAGAALADPPGRVGRVADIEGRVWMFDAETNEWTAALRNRPLTAGDRISTDADARSVLRIGPSTVMVDGRTELEVLRLDDERVSFQLHSGSMALRLRTRETAQEYQVLTREGSFDPERAGHYRIDRRDDISYATVWSGQLRHQSRGAVMTLRAGQRGEFLADSYAQDRLIALERDAFGDWVMAQEAREERSVSARYVSPEMTGSEELDRYGRWEESAEYGAVWMPSMLASDWAPYRYGRWVSISPWGWTWVDDAPWGFAPFHYGRWARYQGRWCWVPGSYVQRPVYAPALVAWVGGPQFGVSVSIGSRPAPVVGWFPLGPREIYVPSYQVSHGYVRTININHVHDVTVINRVLDRRQGPHENYVNREDRDAVTVAPIRNIGSGHALERVRDQDTLQRIGRGPVRIEPGIAQPVAGKGDRRPPERRKPESGIPQGWDRDESARQPRPAYSGEADEGGLRRAPQPQSSAPAMPAPVVRSDEPVLRAVQPDAIGGERRREPMPPGRRDAGREAMQAGEAPGQREPRVMPGGAMRPSEVPQPAPAMRMPAPVQVPVPAQQGIEPSRDPGPRAAVPERRRADKEEATRRPDERREDRRDDRRDNKRRANLE